MILKQSVTYARKFLMVSSSDHVSGKTGKASNNGGDNSLVVKLNKGSGNTGVTAGGAITELDATANPGVYQIALTTTDTNTLGDLWFSCTATGADPTDFCDQVQTQIFTDLSINGSGQAQIASNIKQNAALNGFTFVMTAVTTNAPATGLTVAAQRSLGGAGFGPCAKCGY